MLIAKMCKINHAIVSIPGDLLKIFQYGLVDKHFSDRCIIRCNAVRYVFILYQAKTTCILQLLDCPVAVNKIFETSRVQNYFL